MWVSDRRSGGEGGGLPRPVVAVANRHVSGAASGLADAAETRRLEHHLSPEPPAAAVKTGGG